MQLLPGAGLSFGIERSDGARDTIRVAADQSMREVMREIARKAGSPFHLTVALLNGGTVRACGLPN